MKIVNRPRAIVVAGTLAFIICCALVLCSCTKKSLESANINILSLAPDETAGILYCDMESESFIKANSKPSPFQSDLSNALEKAEDPFVKTLYGVQRRLGLWDNKVINQLIKESVFTIYPEESSTLALTIISLAKEGSDLRTLISIVKEELQKESVQFKESSSGNRTDLYIGIPGIVTGGKKQDIIVSTDGKLLVVSTQPVKIDEAYKKLITKSESKSGIGHSAQFQELLERGRKENGYCMGLIDFLKLSDFVKHISQSTSPLPSTSTSFIETGWYIGAYKDHPTNEIGVKLNTSDPAVNNVLSFLKNSSSDSLLKNTPQQAIFSLQLDTHYYASQALPLIPTTPERAEVLKAIHRIAIGAQNGASSGIFPEVFLILQTDAPEKLSTELVSVIKDLTNSLTGVQFSPWQEKEILGRKVTYTMTPLGVGIFSGSIAGASVLSTSEESFKQVAQSATSGDSLFHKVTKGNYAPLSDSVMFSYFNFKGVAELLESTQGTLSMLSGGKNNELKDSIERLRNLGEASVVVTIDGSELTVKAIGPLG